MKTKLKTLAVSVALIFPALGHAESNTQLKAEIEALKAQMQELKTMLAAQKAVLTEQNAALTEQKAALASAKTTGIDPAEFNRVRVKVEAMEDNQEASGFKGVKISGYIDPTYIYNNARHKGSMSFLHNNYSSNPNDSINTLNADTFTYDNTYFGGFSIKFEKEFEGGVKAMATLHPRRSVSNTYDFGNLFEEAMIWVPLSGDQWKLAAGQAVTYNGYDYIQSNMKKTITSNLLSDFAGPGFMTGAGVEYKEGKWWVRTMVGNINTPHDAGSGKNQGAHWRVDYSKGEFQGWGASGLHGDIYNKRYNYLEADAYFIRGNVTLQGQIEGTTWKESAFNGGDASHFGMSGLFAYKFTPQWEGIVRADYLDNHKNGGGLPTLSFGQSGGGNDCPVMEAGTTTAASNCGDYRNGFGPGAVWNAANGVWELGDINRGAKRSSLTLGLNYQYHTNALLKLELRNDFSDLRSFMYKDGSFKKSNTIFGVQTVVSF